MNNDMLKSVTPVEGPLAEAALRGFYDGMPFTGLLIRAGLTIDIPDGVSKMTYEYEDMSDPGEAIIYTVGLSEGRNDRPMYDLRSLPLPIVHADVGEIKDGKFVLTPRAKVKETDAYRTGKEVGAFIERTVLGIERVDPGVSSLYGLCNYPNRTTLTYDPDDAIGPVVLKLITQARHHGFYGPYALTCGMSVIERLSVPDLLRINVGTADDPIMPLEYVIPNEQFEGSNKNDLVLVQLSSNVIRLVRGLTPRLCEWNEDAYKCLTITVPHPRHDYQGNSGIVHARRTDFDIRDGYATGIAFSQKPSIEFWEKDVSADTPVMTVNARGET